MKTKRIDFDFHPLRILHSLGTSGSVPANQRYDASQNTWIPDFTAANLTLQLSISIQDQDGVLPNGSIIDKLASLSFYEVVNGVETLITAENTNYIVNTSGVNAGRIIIKKNASVASPITVRSVATYYDTRMAQTLTIKDSVLITCSNATTLQTAEIDVAKESVWNPFTDTDNLAITATHRVATTATAVDATKLLCKWYRKDSDGVYTEITGAFGDFPFTILGVSKETLTVNRRIMGNVCALKVVTLYDPTGLSNFVESPITPMVELSIRRRIPAFDYDITGIPNNIPPTTKVIGPKCTVQDANGVIADPLRELSIFWYRATNTLKPTAIVYEPMPCAQGVSPTISTEKMDKTYGMVVGVEVKDLGALLPLSDSDGKVLLDADGKILLGH